MWGKNKILVVSISCFTTIFPIQRNTYFLNFTLFKLSSATPLNWTNLKYCRLRMRYFTKENTVGKEDTTCNTQFILLQQYFLHFQQFMLINFLILSKAYLHLHMFRIWTGQKLNSLGVDTMIYLSYGIFFLILSKFSIQALLCKWILNIMQCDPFYEIF